MNKATFLAAILAAGVSGAAIAQTMDNSDTANPGAPAPADNASGAVQETRPNSTYSAQDPGTSVTTPGVNAPSTTRAADSTETRAPLKGANSFTLGEATRRLEKAGYTNVTGLAKDDQSVWRGMATDKDGQSVDIALDYRGNITAAQK